MRVLAWVGGIVVAILVIAGIVVGGQQAGFWLQHNQTEFEAHNLRDSYGNQERLREDASEKAAEVAKIEAQISELPSGSETVAKLHAQAELIESIACHDIGQINQLTPEAQRIAASFGCE